MKVRELKNFLALGLEEHAIAAALQKYSHWISAIKQAGEYRTSTEKDSTALQNLAELKVIDLKQEDGEWIATLNKSGQQLYQDFYGHGYY